MPTLGRAADNKLFFWSVANDAYLIKLRATACHARVSIPLHMLVDASSIATGNTKSDCREWCGAARSE